MLKCIFMVPSSSGRRGRSGRRHLLPHVTGEAALSPPSAAGPSLGAPAPQRGAGPGRSRGPAEGANPGRRRRSGGGGEVASGGAALRLCRSFLGARRANQAATRAGPAQGLPTLQRPRGTAQTTDDVLCAAPPAPGPLHIPTRVSVPCKRSWPPLMPPAAGSP